MNWDRDLFSKIMTGFGFVMVAIFLGIGIALILFPVFIPDKNMRLVFGFFFIVYGLFRLSRLYQQIKEQKRKEFNNE